MEGGPDKYSGLFQVNRNLTETGTNGLRRPGSNSLA